MVALNKVFAIQLTGNRYEIDKIDEALYSMDNTHRIAQHNKKGFRFMSKSWLPLILFDRIIAWRESGVYNQELEKIYANALRAEEAHKIYFADMERQGNNMIIYYKSKSAYRDFVASLFRGYNVRIIDIQPM